MSDNQECPLCSEKNDAPAGNAAAEEQPRSRAKVTCLVVFLVIVVALGVLLGRGVNAAREAARDCACRCPLKMFTLAMHNYHVKYNCFPPAYTTDADGKPMHSWRVLILPFMEGNDIYTNYRFDEPWDSPNNLGVAKQARRNFQCPSQPDVDYPITNYVMVVGPHTISDGPHSRSIEEITDGTSNTIMLVEVADSGICWNEPRDLRFDEIDFTINGKKRPGIGSHHPKKINAAMCDGSNISLYNFTHPETVKALLTIDGGEEVEWPEQGDCAILGNLV